MKAIKNNWVQRWVIGVLPFYLFTFLPLHAQKPWTFWYWMYGAVSEAGIKADLQGMKDVGLGGCYLMPIRGTQEKPEYQGEAQQLSPKFWKMVDYAMQQADSLGLDMGIHVCDGFALAGGPWIKPEESMHKLVFCDTIVRGGQHRFIMPKPQHYEDYYKDIAVYAIPVGDLNQEVFAYRHGDLKTHYSLKDGEKTTCSDGVTRNDKGVYCADDPCWLQYEFKKPTLVFNVEIEPSGNNIQCQRLLVKASDDGVNFHDVKQLTPPRQGWQNTGYNTTFSIPPTKARFFRFVWTPEGTEPGAEDLDAAKWKPVLRLKNIRLGTLPTVDNWEGKSGLVWRIAPDTPDEDLRPQDCLYASDLVRTTMKGDSIDLYLIGGTWRIMRMGYTSTGHTNATAGGGKGLECDKFSRQAVGKQVDAWFGEFMKRPHHNVIKYMHVDSWECGSQNWSPTFAEEFQRRHGYDITKVLPVMAGVAMVNADWILRDVRQTINELINDRFFATVDEKARQYGVQLSSESVAPTMVSDGMEHYKNVDVPMGEFWLNSPTHDKPNDMLDAISGAHVYGKNIVQAEGFTEVRGVWDETPASIKPLLDRNFALGMNRLFFHVNTHNPWLDRKPGMTLDGIGLFFQRDQTWFPEAKAFVDYITRCQKLLQQGKPVVDIAVYTGEDVPCRALTPDKLVSMLPGLFGDARVASERQRLANQGVPMTESPVGVRHAAGIMDLKDWINPLHGYQYDSMNKDALLTQPFGYQVLVVPKGVKITQKVQERIDQLRGQGIRIIDQPYQQATLQGLARDAELPEGIAYTHRQADGKDIYFLANQTAEPQSFQPTFRNNHSTAVLYNPVTNDYAPYDGTITLPSYGSCFVLFTQGYSIHGGEYHSPRREIAFSTEETATMPWDITFRESGLTLKNQQLFDWSQHQDDRIRYFSGHARYKTTFKHPTKVKGRAWLALPHVKDIAHVWVNGKDCGIAWTAPYEVDITKALKKGNNTLEIEVVNTWHNALRGLDKGKAPYNGIWTNAKYRTKGEELLPAGLLAQPELRIEK
ncbi:MAG: discoidin domain-containing protein [Prevotella sp.]|nr:discoidin domain-containing protein [Prevotella sp.]